MYNFAVNHNIQILFLIAILLPQHVAKLLHLLYVLGPTCVLLHLSLVVVAKADFGDKNKSCTFKQFCVAFLVW